MLLPTTAVSLMTTPVAWSSRIPLPTVAFEWMSDDEDVGLERQRQRAAALRLEHVRDAVHLHGDPGEHAGYGNERMGPASARASGNSYDRVGIATSTWRPAAGALAGSFVRV